MKRHTYISAALGAGLIAAAPGCRAVKSSSAENSEISRYSETVERIVKDTVYVRLPEAQMSYKGADTASILETDLARSRAWIDSAGLLHHTLGHTRRELAVEVAHRETTHTSRADSLRTVTVVKERQHTAARRLRTGVLGWLAGTAAAVVIAAVWRRFGPGARAPSRRG